MKASHDETKDPKKIDRSPSYVDGKVKGAATEPGGRVTEIIEAQTGKMPWVSFLGLSVIGLAVSATLAGVAKKEKDFSGVVGALAPCFLLMGVYNKLVQIDKNLGRYAPAMPEPHVDLPSPTSYLS
jgi:hypothetical protein